MAQTSIVKRVWLLDGGVLNLEMSMLVATQGFGERVDVPVPMYLLETEAGHILVDTGNDPGVIDDPAGTWGADLAAGVRPAMRPENDVRAQLALLGLEPSDIKLVIYTHLHHDHSGGARFFTHAPAVVQKSEYRWAMTPDRNTEHIYLDADFRDPGIRWLHVDGDAVLLPGIHLLRTPGHTPGHQSLVLHDVPDAGTVIIGGDAIYMRDNVRLDLPPGLTSSTVDAMTSIRRLTALAQAHDATLLAGHDPEQWATLPHCPEPLSRPSDDERRYWLEGVRKIYGGDGTSALAGLDASVAKNLMTAGATS